MLLNYFQRKAWKRVRKLIGFKTHFMSFRLHISMIMMMFENDANAQRT